MAPLFTHPGTYVEELPGGASPIPGVETALTAFIGRARRGPIGAPVAITSFADFERAFGGLWADSTLAASVQDFFLNGGARAVVVRLYGCDPGNPEAGLPPPAAIARLQVGGLRFAAASPGRWGVDLRVRVDVDGITDAGAARLGVCKADLFNLSVMDTGTGTTERFLNLTVKDGASRVDRVLAANSALLACYGAVDPDTSIVAGADALAQKDDAVAAAARALNDRQAGDPGADASREALALVAAQAERDDAVNAALAVVSDGLPLTLADFLPESAQADEKGLYALAKADYFNLLCIPPYRAPPAAIDVDPELVAAAAGYCEQRRAMLLLDAPKPWVSASAARAQFLDAGTDHVGTRSANAAMFFPRFRRADVLRGNAPEPSSVIGAVAGVFARTDAGRGVWKAPAGRDATLVGVAQLTVLLPTTDNDDLNRLGINCLRAFPSGVAIWGARTLRGADRLGDEYKYIPVRRTALYIEESLMRGLKWVALEPNGEPLWAQIRLRVGAFLHTLFLNGAFQGATARDAYFVKCDADTTTQNDIAQGVINIVVGFAPLKRGEFVILKLQQRAGPVEA